MPASGATSAPYDCQDGQRDWSPVKQSWCCRKEGQGCAGLILMPPTAAATDEEAHQRNSTTGTAGGFDCHIGHPTGWSEGKRAWCTGAAAALPGSSGSDAAGYHCRGGGEDWERSWSQDKKEWCCLYRGLGCSSSVAYDCAKGAELVAAAWSEGKRSWCCVHSGVGCSQQTKKLFNCRESLESFEIAWSQEKATWCCGEEGLGCEGSGQVLVRAMADGPEQGSVLDNIVHEAPPESPYQRKFEPRAAQKAKAPRVAVPTAASALRRHDSRRRWHPGVALAVSVSTAFVLSLAVVGARACIGRATTAYRRRAGSQVSRLQRRAYDEVAMPPPEPAESADAFIE
mmetsp:Transcript_28419/g.61902  ORF Transcript_28419/g.61902 Transcript_28419/m.61902 type:complete len:342 (-) Transcript_28419:91-1116(-)